MERSRVSDDEIARRMEAVEERRRSLASDDAWKALGEPYLARHKRFAETVEGAAGPWGEAYERAAIAVLEGDSVALTGPRGTGKTALAVCVARAFTSDGKHPVYLTAWDLFARFKRSYGDKTLNEVEIMGRLGKAPLLILDEMQERGETSWEDRTLVRLIDYRYGAMLPTILIANLGRKALAESLGVSICDRLREAGTVIEATWPSFRAKEGGE